MNGKNGKNLETERFDAMIDEENNFKQRVIGEENDKNESNQTNQWVFGFAECLPMGFTQCHCLSM